MEKEQERLELVKQGIHKNYKAMLKRLEARGISKDDAPHVASKVTINAIESRDQLRDVDKLTPWLMAIADNVAKAHLKEQTRLWEREVSIYFDAETGEEIELYETIEDADSMVEEIVMTAVDNAMLWDLTACLNEKEHLIFKLHNIDDYDLVKISEEYDINYNTVRSIHSRACHKLKRRGETLFRKEGMI